MKHSSLLLLVLVYAAFVSLGLPDGAFGVGWLGMRGDLGQPLEALGLVTSLWTMCSAASSFASGYVLARVRTLNVVLLSGLLTGAALLGFAMAPSFAWVMVLALPLGFGAGSVDAGLNHYAAAHYSSRHMNWLHASWGMGATLGPLLLSAAMASPHGWRAGYVVLGSLQLALVALLFAAGRLLRGNEAPAAAALPNRADAAVATSHDPERPSVANSPERTEPEDSTSPGRQPQAVVLWLGPLAYALYSGAEGGIGFWAASVLRDGRGMDAAAAGTMAASFYAAIMLGRVLSGLAADRLGNRRMVRVGLAVSAVGVGVFALPAGALGAFVGLSLLGLGFAPIYPCLMHETPHRFDAETARLVIGRQVGGAYLGSLLLAPLVGVAAGRLGLHVVAPAVGVFVVALAACIVALDADGRRR